MHVSMWILTLTLLFIHFKEVCSLLGYEVSQSSVNRPQNGPYNSIDEYNTTCAVTNKGIGEYWRIQFNQTLTIAGVYLRLKGGNYTIYVQNASDTSSRQACAFRILPFLPVKYNVIVTCKADLFGDTVIVNKISHGYLTLCDFKLKVCESNSLGIPCTKCTPTSSCSSCDGSHYGVWCQHQCSRNCSQDRCDELTGECLRFKDGYQEKHYQNSNNCISCNTFVRPRQEALQCDRCQHWQHRTCNTGITRAEYRRLVHGQEDFDWTCEGCSNNSEVPSQDDEDDVNNTSEVPDATFQMSLTSLVDRENTSEQHTEDEREEEPNEDNTSTAPADATFHISLGSLMDPEDRPVIDPDDRPVIDLEDRPVEDPEDRPVNQQEDQSFVADTSFDVPAAVNEDSIREEVIGDMPEEDEAVVAEYEVVDTGTKRGKRKLVDNRGFQYTIKKQRGDGYIYWRCSKRGKEQHCPATVIQKGDTFQEGLKNHVHPAEPGVHLAIKMKAEVKKKAVDNIFTESAPRIVENVMNAASDVDAPPASRPKPANMTRIVNRVRQNLRPQDPQDLDFELDIGFLEQQMPNFRHVDVYVSGRRHLLMYTDYQLQLLAKAKTWYLDATFRVVNKPWYQLFTIHSFIRGGANMKQIPLAFCFMSSKRKADYYEVLRTIDHLLPDNISLHGFVVDFEAAIWRAVQDRFPGFVIQGCVFHWTQAVYRKAQELGLQRAYNTRGEVHEFIRQVLALPFLPPEHIVETFHHLDRRVQTDLLDSLMEYVWRQWLNNPIFSVRNWSVFMLAIRTNNDVEGWHNRLNSRVAQRGPVPFYLLLVELHKEAKQIPLQAKLISEGKMVRIHKKRSTHVNGKLFAAWKQYSEGEMTTSQLLRRCANVYGPSD